MKKIIIIFCLLLIFNPLYANNIFKIRLYDTKYNGNIYRIFVAIPKNINLQSNKKLPVLYVLDGNKQFPIAIEKASKQNKKLVIVGIGYKDNSKEHIIKSRTKDYTPYATGDDDFKGGGGAEHFYNFIENKLKFWVNNNFPVDINNQTLYGHSFGGLFTLYSLFKNNLSFQNYVAASPSIWWGYGIVIPKKIPLLSTCPQKIIITMGEKEENPNFDEIDDELKTFFLKYKNVIKSRELYEKLLAQCTNIKFYSFKNKSHGDSIDDAIEVAVESINTNE